MLQSSSEFAPGMVYFKHRIKRYDGSHGTTSNVGYTYQDVDGIRTYKIWKQDNESYGNSAVRVIAREVFTSLFEFNSETETTAPDGIVWADEVLEGLSSNEIESWNGKLNADGNNSTSATSNNIFNNSAERPDGSAYDVASNDVVLVQDATGNVVRRTTVNRLHKTVNNNLRSLATDKLDKSDIVQNLNAENESKVPSQKAVRNAVSVLDEGKINKSDIVQYLNAENESKVPSQKAVMNAFSVLSNKIDKVTKSTRSYYGEWFIGFPITLCYLENASSTQSVEYDVGTLVRNLYKEVKVNSDDCGRLFVLMNETDHTLNLTGFAGRTSTQTFQLLYRRLTAFVFTNGWYRMDV
jgi:hypothetical protein